MLKLIFLFIFGLTIGSFLNVVIYRSASKESSRRSICPNCKSKLKIWDLVPILSFLLLAGKCRYCHKPISLRYPLVELTTAFGFTIVGLIVTNDFLELVYTLFIISTLEALFFIDLFFGILPNRIILLGLFSTFIYWLLRFDSLTPTFIVQTFLTAFVLGGLFFSIVYFSRGKAMGGGDVKLVFLMGLVLGWPKALPALFFAFLTGALLSVMLIMLGAKRFGQTIPFGPFLTSGAFVSLFWGNQIINWYLSLAAR